MVKYIPSVLIIVLIIVGLTHITIEKPEVEQTKINNDIYSINAMTSFQRVQQTLPIHVEPQHIKPPVKEEKVLINESKKPHYDNIPLDDEILQYTWDLSQEKNLSYEMVLALIYVESSFQKDVISPTHDYGLTQIHQSNIKDFAINASIENVKPLDPKQNVKMAIYHLSYLRDYWVQQGYSDEDTYNMTLLSYHKGIAGANKWVRERGMNSEYVDKISEYKSEIEQDIFLKEGE